MCLVLETWWYHFNCHDYGLEVSSFEKFLSWLPWQSCMSDQQHIYIHCIYMYIYKACRKWYVTSKYHLIHFDLMSQNDKEATCRNHFVYALSQWETTLHCNVASHWLGTYTKWSLKLHLLLVSMPKFCRNMEWQQHDLYRLLSTNSYVDLCISEFNLINLQYKMQPDLWPSPRQIDKLSKQDLLYLSRDLMISYFNSLYTMP